MTKKKKTVRKKPKKQVAASGPMTTIVIQAGNRILDPSALQAAPDGVVVWVIYNQGRWMCFSALKEKA